MARKMTHAPVYFAIMQARFNQILALDSYAPQIQEHLRKHGFPDVQKGALAAFNLNLAAPTDESPPQVPVAQTPRYTFSNIDRTAAFILDQGALSLQTTEYDVFDTFCSHFQHGLQVVHDAVNLSFTDRIGFRYLDAVFPRTGESIGDYLNASVLGLGQHFQETIVHSFSETRLRTSSDIDVVARVIIQKGRVGFPPDLLPNPLRVPDRFQILQGHHAILDIDGFLERRETFNVDRVGDHLRLIHDEIAEAFRATVTPHAIKVWE
jgi:uncharacterized protein (TIGR04255 family)